MLRPATPLSVVLFIAFAFQLLATISAPIIKAIPLGDNAGTTFGVFGTCTGDKCSPFGLGYDASPNNSANDFSFKNAGTRHTLSTILILHPVAALFTLVCFCLAVAAHFHGPSHSQKYLLGLVILMLPTFLISLLAFVIDLVLFLPHAGWGSWIMLGATVLIFICGILTCAMRRTLISRKESKKRIAENAEMNGENFYGQQRAASPPPLSQQPTASMVNGAPGADKLPGFAVYDTKSRISGDDDRTPLNASTSRTATGISANSGKTPTSDDGLERYGRGGGMPRGRGRGGYGTPPRDEYGNPLPPMGYGQPGNPGDYMGRPSQDSQRSRGRGGYPPRGGNPRGGPMRGRGGPPRGRGGPMRGGPMGPMRGGPMGGPMNDRGGPMGVAYGGSGSEYGQAYGEPDCGQPRGQDYGQAYGEPTPYGQGPFGRDPSPGLPSAPGYGRQRSPGPPSAPGYGRQQSPGPPSNPGARQPSPGPPSAPGYAIPYGAVYTQRESLARAESPPPLPNDHPIHPEQPMPPDPSTIGQAVEMDHLTGSPANTPGFIPPPHPFRDSDSDVQGMVGMQQGRAAEPMSPSSLYSSQRTDSSAPPHSRFASTARQGTPPLQAISGPPAMTGARQTPQIQQAPSHDPTRGRVSGDNYYEDVDPRFVEEESHPAALMPGPQRHPLEQQASYDSVNNGPSSDSSHFTSISERGINPEWRPDNQYNQYGPGGVPNRGPPQGPSQGPPQQRDFLLSGNPDFEVGRGRGGMGRSRGGPGMI